MPHPLCFAHVGLYPSLITNFLFWMTLLSSYKESLLQPWAEEPAPSLPPQELPNSRIQRILIETTCMDQNRGSSGAKGKVI